MRNATFEQGLVMNIEKLTLQNFRNVEGPKTFSLNPNFTAFIGANGKGKSTILHALRIAAGSFFLRIPDVKKRHIWRDEIRAVLSNNGNVTYRYPVNVEAVGKLADMDQFITWRRQWVEGSSSTSSSEADVSWIRHLGWTKYDAINNQQEEGVELPVIAYFGIERAVGAGRVSKGSRRQPGRRVFKDGYQDWDSMMATKFHYQEWLGLYDLMVSESREYQGTREAFFAAVREANPFISRIDFRQEELWVQVNIENEESGFLPISLHSDGVHYFTEMVAELAYRCIVLNGYKHLNAVRETSGIVMIDELDLHLHPNWQRHVAADLKDAFPKIQFVVTTHSPFIVQSLKSDELVILDEEIRKSGDPFKKSLEEVAATEMGVEDIPRSQQFIEMEKLAAEYFTLIRSGQTSENSNRVSELRQLLNELEERFSEDAAFVAALKLERKAVIGECGGTLL